MSVRLPHARAVGDRGPAVLAGGACPWIRTRTRGICIARGKPLQQDRTRLINRLQGLLVTAGGRVAGSGDFEARMAAAHPGANKAAAKMVIRPTRILFAFGDEGRAGSRDP